MPTRQGMVVTQKMEDGHHQAPKSIPYRTLTRCNSSDENGQPLVHVALLKARQGLIENMLNPCLRDPRQGPSHGAHSLHSGRVHASWIQSTHERRRTRGLTEEDPPGQRKAKISTIWVEGEEALEFCRCIRCTPKRIDVGQRGCDLAVLC